MNITYKSKSSCSVSLNNWVFLKFRSHSTGRTLNLGLSNGDTVGSSQVSTSTSSSITLLEDMLRPELEKYKKHVFFVQNMFGFLFKTFFILVTHLFNINGCLMLNWFKYSLQVLFGLKFSLQFHNWIIKLKIFNKNTKLSNISSDCEKEVKWENIILFNVYKFESFLSCIMELHYTECFVLVWFLLLSYIVWFYTFSKPKQYYNSVLQHHLLVYKRELLNRDRTL